ncbi:efflux RND transporter permease subunit [Bacillus safensis]|uniref:efflux RND transporter permease subunit n=1 Tax=Bacillus TaxID=1386 RepID=UPI0011AA68CF|nr:MULTISPECIES: efflux RND transporter permease subunit [Bacillus]MBW4850641.1 efflux RND transporter permease subunit [Bacillaceae bacterium]MBW4852805.1 efflux RND transporter permease subunit [Bacillaceae bacterium]MBW4855155.1 efflux RND transporter permease subunit [Bacillaceae bacterium]MCY7585161.1 efflux RND transporter permease subunit [Bacillus safensis]MCY7589310.1 efflux RND transporter permease subunit [Bacillus safensis]
MNSIINFVLKNKFAVWLMTIIVTVAGLYAGLNMKQESIPNINTPVITVSTTYPGATPDEVSDKVTDPIEKSIQNLNGVSVVTSNSFENASSIQIEYDYSKDMDEAKKEIEDAISNIDFPENAEKPKIARFSINAIPILALSVSGDKESLQDLTQKVENDLVPSLQGLDGVSSVEASGQQIKEVEFSFKEKKLKEYGLDEETVQNMIKGSDVNVPLGLYTFGNKQKSVVVDGNILSVKDLKNMRIPVTPSAGGGAGSAGAGAPSSSAGAQGAEQQAGSASQQQAAAQQQTGAASSQSVELPTIKLSEIADIKVVKEAESISRTNGKDSIGLQIVKGSDANTVSVAEEVTKELEKFKKDNKGIKVSTTYDQAEPIKESVSTMLNKAIIGAIFAIIIILLFLRDIKSTLISVISIPLSLLIAVLLLNQLDITLNIMTLGAMTVAIGRVVDDSIVVIENIYRRMALKDEPLKGKALVREATKEMFIPIMSSTIVTIAVFLPLALVGGMIGELFIPFALTIVFALLASLLVAITIVPMMAHTLFKKNLYGTAKKVKEHKPSKLAGGYRRVLNWTLNHKWITSGIAILMLVGSLFLAPLVGVSFLPQEAEKTAMVTYTPEPGQTREQAIDETKKAEEYLMKRDHVNTVQYSLGSSNAMTASVGGNSNGALFFVQYDEDTPNFDKEKDRVVKALQDKASKGEWKSQDFSSAGASNTVTYYVYGDKASDIEGTVKDVENILKDEKNLKNVSTSLSEKYDEYTFNADQEKLAKLGLTASQIAQAIAPQNSETTLTKVTEDGKELDVKLQTEKDEYKSKKDLENKKITTPTGQEVRIGDVVKVKDGTTANTVTKRDGKIYAEVSGDMTTDDVSSVTQDVQKKVDKLDLKSGVTIDTGGVSADIQESFTQLGLAMLAAVAIVYLVLVITFGGGLAPFAILFSLPFTVIGALAGLFIAKETISLNAMIGLLMLIGIVVTNAIVLIDRVIHKEQEGLSTREALLEAGATRLRPILMTALATIGALLPLALGFEGGSQIVSKGLGVTVIGGLTSSTLLTLVIVPIVYEMLSKFKRKKKYAEEE